MLVPSTESPGAGVCKDHSAPGFIALLQTRLPFQDLHRFRGLRPDFGGSVCLSPPRRTQPLPTPQASRDGADLHL